MPLVPGGGNMARRSTAPEENDTPELFALFRERLVAARGRELRAVLQAAATGGELRADADFGGRRQRLRRRVFARCLAGEPLRGRFATALVEPSWGRASQRASCRVGCRHSVRSTRREVYERDMSPGAGGSSRLRLHRRGRARRGRTLARDSAAEARLAAVRGRAEHRLRHGHGAARLRRSGVRGADGLAEMVQGHRASIPNLSVTIDHQFTEGDYVATRFTIRGRHVTDYDVEFTGLTVSRCRGGKIEEEWEIVDVMSLLAQIGQLPEPSTV
jgi:predicted ester cyclase